MANESTYKGIYAMHKYWGKKPFNEVSKFIEQYSTSDDTVMDCFCGSGVTLIEAVKAGRKAVGVDLNPIAIKLANVSMTVVEIDKITATDLLEKASSIRTCFFIIFFLVFLFLASFLAIFSL